MNFWRKLLLQETENTWVQFVRYIVVGGAAFCVDYGTLALGVEVLRLKQLPAGAIAFIAGLTVNYLLSVAWIFRTSRLSSRWAEFSCFALIGVIGLGINACVLWFFQDVLAARQALGAWIPARYYYLVGKPVSTAIVFVWNFLARKFLLYKK